MQILQNSTKLHEFLKNHQNHIVQASPRANRSTPHKFVSNRHVRSSVRLALGDATVVLLNGNSAGGHATYLHADRMAGLAHVFFFKARQLRKARIGEAHHFQLSQICFNCRAHIRVL